MRDLIEALQILAKYLPPEEERWPTTCAHDELYVCVDPESVSEADKARLDALGFIDSEEETFVSFRFGSC